MLKIDLSIGILLLSSKTVTLSFGFYKVFSVIPEVPAMDQSTALWHTEKIHNKRLDFCSYQLTSYTKFTIWLTKLMRKFNEFLLIDCSCSDQQQLRHYKILTERAQLNCASKWSLKNLATFGSVSSDDDFVDGTASGVSVQRRKSRKLPEKQAVKNKQIKGFIFNFSVRLCSPRLISFPATILSSSVGTNRDE